MTYQPPQNPYQNGPSQPNYGGQQYPQQPGQPPGPPPGQQPGYPAGPPPGQQPGYGQPGGQPGFAQQDPYAQPTYGQQPGYPPQQPYGQYPPGGPPPQQSGGGAKAGIIVAVIAVLAIGGILAGYYFLGEDDEESTASDTETTTDDNTDDATDAPDNEPGNGLDEEDTDLEELLSTFELPAEGECVDWDDAIVDCDDSSASHELVLWVTDPEDPDPEDSQHNEAGQAACEDVIEEGFYYWVDTSHQSGSGTWDPDEDRLLAIGCATTL